jgi:tetratricopeptide (TPR) repeat protein
MRRRTWQAAVWLLAPWLMLSGSGARAAAQNEPANPRVRQALTFLDRLRDRGYFDLASDYIENLRKDPKTPSELMVLLDFEQGRNLLDQAGQDGDPERRNVVLEQARQKLDAFAKAEPNHPRTTQALVQLGRLFIERGHTALLLADETKVPAEAATRRNEARASFEQARQAFAQAEPRLKQAHEAFPTYLDRSDPRYEERTRAHVALMDAQLQKAICDYEEAQTYPADSDTRKQLLDRAIAAFEDLHKRYRSQMAGLHARMLQGKSYEEKGELGPAMGIYNELMEHSDAELSDLKRIVAYYRIIVSTKRGEHPLAVDDCVRWMQAFGRYRVTPEGLGVQLLLAKNILAQLDKLPENQRDDAKARAVERLVEVVRYYSPYKPEALALLEQYRPKAALNANAVANLNYDDAMAQAQQAIDSQDWDRAMQLLNQAVRRADPRRDPDRASRARYLMAYVLFQSGRYYESAAVAEFLARRYPQSGMAAKAAEIGIASHTQAYNVFNTMDRASDLDRLVNLADYTAGTWPDSEEADTARLAMGEVAMGRGQYPEAARAFESVRAASPRHLDAQVKAGDAHWRQSLVLRGAERSAEADAEAKRSLELVSGALEARRQAQVPPTDPGWIRNVNALAEIHRGSGRPQEALALLEPLAQALQNATSTELAPLRETVLILLLQCHLDAGKPDLAVADMKVLESLGTTRSKLTQLYYQLSRTLQKEIEAHETQGDRVGAQRSRDAFEQFLKALVSSEAGQSFDSLAFAGDALLSLNLPGEAEKVLDQILATYESDDAFRQSPQAEQRLLRVKLLKSRSLRLQKKYEEAHKLATQLLEQNPRMLETHLEKGMVLEDRARASGRAQEWELSHAHWQKLVKDLERVRPRRPEYYEALYHVAEALVGLNRKTEALKTLKGALALAPNVGRPDIKQKYQQLLAKLGG